MGDTVRLPPLPADGATPAEIGDWIDTAMEMLDDSPDNKYWRWEVNGRRSLAEIVADVVPPNYRIDIWVPIGEMRLLNDAARARNLGTRPFLKSAVATVLCACEGYSSSEFPTLAKSGLILPRR
jgi:hypothetical protein